MPFAHGQLYIGHRWQGRGNDQPSSRVTSGYGTNGCLRASAREWEALGRDDDALWRGARLDRADDVLGAHRTELPDPVATFLARSLEVRAAERKTAAEQELERARTARRVRRQRSSLAAALVVVVIVAAVAWQQRQDAVGFAQRAEDRARAATLGLVTAAGEARAEDWTRSLLLAVEARRLDDSPRTQEALLATLSNPSPVPTELHAGRTALAAMAVDLDSDAIVTKDSDGVVTVLAPDGSVQRIATATPASFHRGGLAVAGGLVVSAGVAEAGAGVAVHDVGDGSRLGSLDTNPGEIPDVAFHPDGSQFAVTGDGRVRIVDVASLRLGAADDTWLATGHIDGSVEIRHAGDLRVETTLADLAASGDGFVTEVDFTDASAPQALLVATVGTDAATWSVPSWERLARGRVGVTAHFAPDGRVLTSDQDGTVRLRDAQLSVQDTYRGLPLPVIRPRFSGDGARSSPSTTSPTRPASGEPSRSHRSVVPSRWRVVPAGSPCHPTETAS